MAGQVLVRLPQATADALAACADAAGLTAAAYARRALVEAVGTDPAEAVPVARRRPPRQPTPEAVLAVNGLREVLAETHGTLRQVAGLKRRAGAEVADLAAVDTLIRRLAAEVRELDALKQAIDTREETG
jgi:hypothetical protein